MKAGIYIAKLSLFANKGKFSSNSFGGGGVWCARVRQIDAYSAYIRMRMRAHTKIETANN